MADKYERVVEKSASRGEERKRAVYRTPVILSLPAVFSYAAKGSGWTEQKPDAKELKKAKQ